MRRVRRIYLDNASTTQTHPEVLSTYKELLDIYYANSESLYDEGSQINRMLEKARNSIAGLLEVYPQEIIFTSGSSESNSAAIKSVCFAQPSKKHIITTQIEHSSILNACCQMENVFGYDVTYLPVSSEGTISVEDLKKALREDTAIVSIMYVNNETGAINPIEECKEYIKKHSQAYFHVDLTQAIGKIDCHLSQIDLASISAHKIEGLKGSGILIKKKHVPFVPLINGGEQEFGIRGGTSNALVNLVFAKTLRLSLEAHQKYENKLLQMHQYLIDGLREIDGIELNSPLNGISSVVNFSFESIPSEVMQNALNRAGFMISARSTCESKSNNPSYVLKAMGMSDRRASSCIRVSFSYRNDIEDLRSFLAELREIIKQYGKI